MSDTQLSVLDERMLAGGPVGAARVVRAGEAFWELAARRDLRGVR